MVWLALQTYMNPVQEQQPNYMAARIEVPPLFPPPQRHQSAKCIVASLDSTSVMWMTAPSPTPQKIEVMSGEQFVAAQHAGGKASSAGGTCAVIK